MKTKKEIRNEQLLEAAEVAHRYYNSEKKFDPNEHDTPTVFFSAVLVTTDFIGMMRKSDSIPTRLKNQFTKSFEDVTGMCCNDFVKDGDEGHFIAGMMTFAVIIRDIRAMLEQKQEAE